MPSDARSRISIANVVGSIVLALALVLVFFRYGSELALAQAADSISDVLTGTLLAWAARAAAAPADDEHPLGHARAEPIAALVVAVLAGVLAAEVFRDATVALLGGGGEALAWPVACVFAAKVVFKLAIAGLSSASLRQRSSPVLDALRTDARNDALVGSVALIGFGLSRAGLVAIDPVLAMLVSVYVAFSSVRLAHASGLLLLGTSASIERREALTRLAKGVDGVLGVSRLVAISHGAALHVEIEVEVDGALRVDRAHEIAHAVEAAIRGEPDVAHVVVHVGPDTPTASTIGSAA